MSLTMSNAKYARSQTGTNTIISNLESDCKNLRTALTGKNLDELVRVFDSYWVGPDHDAFVRDLRSRANGIASQVTTMQNIVREGLQSDIRDFNTKQSTFYKK